VVINTLIIVTDTK